MKGVYLEERESLIEMLESDSTRLVSGGGSNDPGGCQAELRLCELSCEGEDDEESCEEICEEEFVQCLEEL